MCGLVETCKLLILLICYIALCRSRGEIPFTGTSQYLKQEELKLYWIHQGESPIKAWKRLEKLG